MTKPNHNFDEKSYATMSSIKSIATLNDADFKALTAAVKIFVADNEEDCSQIPRAWTRPHWKNIATTFVENGGSGFWSATREGVSSEDDWVWASSEDDRMAIIFVAFCLIKYQTSKHFTSKRKNAASDASETIAKKAKTSTSTSTPKSSNVTPAKSTFTAVNMSKSEAEDSEEDSEVEEESSDDKSIEDGFSAARAQHNRTSPLGSATKKERCHPDRHFTFNAANDSPAPIEPPKRVHSAVQPHDGTGGHGVTASHGEHREVGAVPEIIDGKNPDEDMFNQLIEYPPRRASQIHTATSTQIDGHRRVFSGTNHHHQFSSGVPLTAGPGSRDILFSVVMLSLDDGQSLYVKVPYDATLATFYGIMILNLPEQARANVVSSRAFSIRIPGLDRARKINAYDKDLGPRVFNSVMNQLRQLVSPGAESDDAVVDVEFE